MVRIVALVENNTYSTEYRCKHGLSLYIETSKHKILFDLGPNGLFIENAKKKQIDISQIDTVIISHGHKDHGGGLKAFLELNSKAKIYVRKEAFEAHYIKVLGIPFNVGVNNELRKNPQIIFTDEYTVIDEELTLFSIAESATEKSKTYLAKSHRVLYTKRNGQLVSDDFSHEQNLILTQNGKNVLLSGCSHAGIVNIRKKAEDIIGGELSVVIGGFHLYNPPTRKYESVEVIDGIARALAKQNGVYYTCHCTGKKAYERMKGTLDDRLQYLSTGMEVNI